MSNPQQKEIKKCLRSLQAERADDDDAPCQLTNGELRRKLLMSRVPKRPLSPSLVPRSALSEDEPIVPVGALVMLHIVYAIVYRPLDLIVYVGSTGRTEHFERADEHLRICGGARRVAITFAQRWFQPVLNFFEFRELWRGECTSEHALGIEQHFIDKHGTKVSTPRSRESCVAHDVDLMQPGVTPRQLNLKNACVDASVVAWAARRVAHDSTITVHLSPAEQARTNHVFELQRLAFEAESETTAPLVASACVDKYAAMPHHARIGVTEVHADLNRVYAALGVYDGTDARRCCRAKLLAFNLDHHAGETWSGMYVAAEFNSIKAALGMGTVHVVVHDKAQTSEEAFIDLVQQVAGMCKSAKGKLVTLKVCQPLKQNLCEQ